MIIPYEVEAGMPRWPWVNFGIIGACVLFFVLMISGTLPDSLLEMMILDGWNPVGLGGHMFLHADLIHLFGNMLFLWVFGNAMCAKLGNIRYALLYVGMGLFGAVLHNLFDGSPAVGASGAINGVLGMFMAINPIVRVHGFYAFFFGVWGKFTVTGSWLILFWFVMDLLGAFSGGGTIAYWAHIGGFLFGLGAGMLLLKLDLVELPEYATPTLYDFISGRHKASHGYTRQKASASDATAIETPAASNYPLPPSAPDGSGAWRYLEWYHEGCDNFAGRIAITGISLAQIRILTGAPEDDPLFDFWPLAPERLNAVHHHACGPIPRGPFNYYFAAYSDQAPV